MHKKQFIIKLLVIIVCIVILLIIFQTIKTPSTHKKMRLSTAPTVSVQTVNIAHYQPSIKALGILSAIHGVVLKTPTSGLITKVLFESNQTVKKGQLLLEVDPKQLQAELISAQVELTTTRLTYERYRQLLRKNTISQSTYDTAKAAFMQARAALIKAKAALNNVMIRAPFQGKIGIRQVQIGDFVASGDTISALQQLNPLWVDFSIPSKFLGKIKLGQKITLTNEAFPQQTFVGKIIAISPLANSDTDSINLRATVDNPQDKLLPGLLVKVTQYLGKVNQRLLVPVTAIVYNNKGEFAYKVVGKIASLVPITLGNQVAQSLIVEKGLHAGDTIVIAGTNKIHGDKSEINPKSATKTKISDK